MHIIFLHVVHLDISKTQDRLQFSYCLPPKFLGTCYLKQHPSFANRWSIVSIKTFSSSFLYFSGFLYIRLIHNNRSLTFSSPYLGRTHRVPLPAPNMNRWWAYILNLCLGDVDDILDKTRTKI